MSSCTLLATTGPIATDDARRAWQRMREEAGAVDGFEAAGARLASAPEPPRAWDGCVAAVDGWLDGDGAEDPAREVVARYRRAGIEGLRGIAGEMAFVLWDSAARRLVAGCDPIGTRTLAYAEVPGGVVVASRVLTLLRDPRVPRAWNDEYLADVMCDLRVQPPGATAFRAIRRLPPGFALVADGGSVREVRFDALDGHDHAAPSRDTQGWYDALWDRITEAVRARARRTTRSCVALSGGLDSTVVAASILRARESIDAFSMLAEGDAGERERQLVRLFCAQHPQITPRVVDVSHARALDGDGLPLTDDPVVTGPAFTHARASLFEAIRSAGFDAVFDGEGGDEIFDLAVRLHDVVRARDWHHLATHLRGRERVRLRATVWRQLVVPSLPAPLLGLWLARERRRIDPIPPWMNRAFRERESTRAAVGRGFRRPAARYEDAIAQVLACGSNVAARQSLQALRRAYGLEGLSPLLDRRVVELVAHMPAHLRIDPRHTKGLVRHASRGILPEDVRWSPKENGPYEQLQLAGLAGGPRLAERLARTKESALVRDFVDAPTLERAIAACGAGSDAVSASAMPTYRGREKIYALLELAAWHARVREAYGLD